MKVEIIHDADGKIVAYGPEGRFEAKPGQSVSTFDVEHLSDIFGELPPSVHKVTGGRIQVDGEKHAQMVTAELEPAAKQHKAKKDVERSEAKKELGRRVKSDIKRMEFGEFTSLPPHKQVEILFLAVQELLRDNDPNTTTGDDKKGNK